MRCTHIGYVVQVLQHRHTHRHKAYACSLCQEHRFPPCYSHSTSLVFCLRREPHRTAQFHVHAPFCSMLFFADEREAREYSFGVTKALFDSETSYIQRCYDNASDTPTNYLLPCMVRVCMGACIRNDIQTDTFLTCVVSQIWAIMLFTVQCFHYMAHL